MYMLIRKGMQYINKGCMYELQISYLITIIGMGRKMPSRNFKYEFSTSSTSNAFQTYVITGNHIYMELGILTLGFHHML